MTETTIAEATAEAVAEAATPAAAASEPHTTCAQCARAFDWRDEQYAHASVSGLCKRCAQRHAVRVNQRTVAFHPATRTVKAPGAKPGEKPREVLVTHNRATRRGHGGRLDTQVFNPTIAPKSRKPTRAERRATARKQAGEKQATLAAAAVQAA